MSYPIVTNEEIEAWSNDHSEYLNRYDTRRLMETVIALRKEIANLRALLVDAHDEEQAK